MKVTVIHGENNSASRQAFVSLMQKAKARGWTIQKLDGTGNLAEQIGTPSLFGEKTVYVLDDFNKTSTKNQNWLSQNQFGENTFLLIYSQTSLTGKMMGGFPKNTKIEEYNYPKKIFELLEAFVPQNTAAFLKLLSEVLKHQPVELVFALLAKHLRDLFWIRLKEQLPPYPSWRLTKLEKQANKFTTERLAETISLLAEADFKAKTSDAGLINLLDLVAIRQLE